MRHRISSSVPTLSARTLLRNCAPQFAEHLEATADPAPSCGAPEMRVITTYLVFPS